MSDAWLAFLVIFAMLLVIWIADSRERPMTKSEQRRMFFSRPTACRSIACSEAHGSGRWHLRLREKRRNCASHQYVQMGPRSSEIAAQFVDRV